MEDKPKRKYKTLAEGRKVPAPYRHGPLPLISDPKVLRAFCQAAELGLPMEDCAWHAGVTPDTARQWARKAEEGDPVYVHFFETAQRAAANGRFRVMQSLHHLADGTDNRKAPWQIWCWMLERRQPHHYGLVPQLRGVNVEHARVEATAKDAVVAAEIAAEAEVLRLEGPRADPVLEQREVNEPTHEVQPGEA